MLDWLQGIISFLVVLIGTIAAVLEIIGFMKPDWRDKIRERLPRIVRHRFFTHGVFLFLGIVVGNFTTTWSPLQAPTPSPTPKSIAIATPSPTIVPKSTFTALPTSTPLLATEPYGTYEWQWAGESWYGRVTLAKQDGNDVIQRARVGVIEKIVTLGRPDVTQMSGRLLELVRGTFSRKSNNAIEIHLTVDKVNRRTNQPERETIDGTLLPIPCYAGKVVYAGAFEGDMILVRYVSTVGSVVDDWFRQSNPDPAWFRYK